MTRQTVGNESRKGNLNATTITSESVTATNLTTTGTATFTGVTATGAGVVDQALQYSAEESVLRNLPARVHPAETLLKQAVWWIDSAHSDSARQRVENLGWGGSALDAQLGSANSGLRIEPLDGYIYLPGIASNSLSVPDAAALDITGDIEIVLRVTAPDWTPSAERILVGKMPESGATGYALAVRTSGALSMYWGDGTFRNANSTASLPFADGSGGWIKVTLDVNNGASGRDIKFYTASDSITEPTTWTQLGSTVTQATATSISANTDSLFIGAFGTAGATSPFAHSSYRTIIRNGIDGTKVLDIDCSQAVIDRPQFTALTGQVVTINDTSRDSNDAKYLDWTGENYVWLPGVGANHVTTPDAAALDLTGDLTLTARIAADDWTPAATMGVINKGYNTAYELFIIATTGVLRLGWHNGTTWVSANSTVAPTVADGAALWVRVTLDVDNGASAYEVKFYTAADSPDLPTSWTQLGSTVTGGTTTAVAADANSLSLGGYIGVTPFAGKIHRAIVASGLHTASVPVLDIDTSLVASGAATSFTARTGQTVTINRSTSGRKAVAVCHPVWLLGTDDTIIVADSALIDLTAGASLSAFLVYRRWNGEDSKRLLTKKNAVSPFAGWQLSTTDTGHGIVAVTTDSTVTNYAAFSPTGTAGALTAVAGVWNGGTNQVTAYLNGVAGTPSSVAAWGDCSNAEILAAGAGSNLGTFTDMELVAALVFRRALTASEIALLSNYYSARIGA